MASALDLEHPPPAWPTRKSFVPPSLASFAPSADLEAVPLGMHREQSMTVLFSDIRGFTTLSESMAPAECFDFINAYLGAMEPHIANNGGLVDKYIGDAILALFPQGVDSAVQAGIGMLSELRAFNARRRGTPIQIGIGLNTGIVAFGTIGGGTHVETTVLGDAVNLSSRLESATKFYGTPLIIGERTLYSLLDPTRYAIRFLDRVRVKGKHHPESLYEVFEADPPEQRAGKLATRQLYEEALAYYHLRETRRAIPLLHQCLEAVPDDTPARIYLERCTRHLATGEHEGSGELEGILEWGDKYKLDVADMDEQHEELLRQINRLGEDVRRGDTGSRDEVLRFLAEYALDHFACESRLMRAAGYPLRGQHEHEHAVFVRYFHELKREIQAGRDPLYLVFRIQLFLVDWFVSHTSRTDRHLAQFLQGLDCGPPSSSLL